MKKTTKVTIDLVGTSLDIKIEASNKKKIRHIAVEIEKIMNGEWGSKERYYSYSSEEERLEYYFTTEKQMNSLSSKLKKIQSFCEEQKIEFDDMNE